MRPTYPPPPTSDVSEVHHGETVPDPYRPLEDANAAATAEWVQAQNALTEQVLSGVAERATIRGRVAELWDYPKTGAPFERGGRWFQMRNSGLQAQPVLHVAAAPGDAGSPLIDPNTMSEDGTVALSGLGPSPDGSLVAYATSDGGSDWMTWRVRDVATGADRDDLVRWSKFSGASWTADGTAFFYTGAPAPAPGEELTGETRALRVMGHRLGTDPAADTVEFEAPDQPDWVPTAGVTENGRWLVVTVGRGTGTETKVLVRDLTEPGSTLVALNPDFEAKDLVISDAGGDGFLILTDRGAARGRIVRGRPGVAATGWPEVVAETPDTLVDASVGGGHIVCHYLRDAHSVLRVHGLDGSLVRELPMPGPVSLGGAVEGRETSPLIHFVVVSFLQSGAVMAHDLQRGETWELSPSAAAFDAGRYVTEQVFAPSPDGTLVPMFVTRAADRQPDGDAPVLLYGYGGFNVPLTPGFSVTYATWLDRGGVVAVANLRGGGEYGRDWHDAGRLAHKQNVFDDFCACARWLVDSGWSRPGRIAISGGSNGGLLVGACLTQHPELFGAAVAEVGVMDMLRFHLFTIGWAWKSDYGDPDDPEQYRWLRAYSPLHNLRPGTCYPPTLLMTGDHDDRVVPAHSYKFAAALQAAQGCDRPVLLRVATSAGHGAGKPTAKLIDEAADKLAFLELALGPAAG